MNPQKPSQRPNVAKYVTQSEMKQYIDTYLGDIRAELRRALISDLRKYVDEAVARELSDLRRAQPEPEPERQQSNQLAVIGTEPGEMSALVAKVSNSAAAAARDLVIKDINETLVPRINKLTAWVAYNTQDTTDIVDKYRLAVVQQSDDREHRLLTDGDGNNGRLTWSDGRIGLAFGKND